MREQNGCFTADPVLRPVYADGENRRGKQRTERLVFLAGARSGISFMILSGWLTIADWRIALSNIGGLAGTAFHQALRALAGS